MDGYRTRTMTRDDVALAVDWAAQEGWNPGLHDAASFPRSRPQGFFVGELAGEPVASISVVKYGAASPSSASTSCCRHFAARPRLGAVAARHGQRGGRQVGLDGVVAQQDNYRKSGFSLAWRNVRYEGAGHSQPARATRAWSCRCSRCPSRDVAAYDRPFFPADRARFLRAWLQQADASPSASSTSGRLQGYGFDAPLPQRLEDRAAVRRQRGGGGSALRRWPARPARASRCSWTCPEPNARAANALARRHGMRWCSRRRGCTPARRRRLPMERLRATASRRSSWVRRFAVKAPSPRPPPAAAGSGRHRR
jgi:hypothetical protein